MSKKTLAVPEFFVLYKDRIVKLDSPSPLSDEERKAEAESVMDGMGFFGQAMNNIESIDQVIDALKKGEESFFKLLFSNNFKAFAAKMFICKKDKVREYGKERGKKGVLNLVEGELFAEFPALKINDRIFYRKDAKKASNDGFDLQNILSESLLRILKKQGLIRQGLSPLLVL